MKAGDDFSGADYANRVRARRLTLRGVGSCRTALGWFAFRDRCQAGSLTYVLPGLNLLSIIGDVECHSPYFPTSSKNSINDSIPR
jgi:hypothetical protein